MDRHSSAGRLLSVFVKVLISALLLYLSLRAVNLEGLGQRLSAADPRWLALILFLLCVQVPVLAMRWREIAGVCGADLPLGAALVIISSACFSVSPAVDGRRRCRANLADGPWRKRMGDGDPLGID